MTMAVHEANQVPGWMTEIELTWLAQYAASLSEGAVWCEVGTWMGKSWTAGALSLPANSTIIAVDTFRGEAAEPQKYVQAHGPVLTDFLRTHEPVRQLRPDLRSSIMAMLSVDAARLVPDGSCDVVFIDANHETEHVREDLWVWTPKLRRGGLLCGHDIDYPGVKAALNGRQYSVDAKTRGGIWCLT